MKELLKKGFETYKTMRVAVDARMYNASGIGTYIQNLIGNNCYDFALGNQDELKDVKEIQNIIEYDSPIYGIKEQLKFPYKKLKKLKPDLLHIPHYNVPIFYRGNMIVTIHDTTHLVLDEFLPNKLAKIYAKIMMKIAIKKAKVILTVSENTKKDLIKYFKVDEDKIKVTYLGVKENIKEKSKEEIKYLYEKFNIPRNKKLLMYVGNLKPHKNLERLLEAFSKLENNNEYFLLLVGKAFENYNILEEREEELNIKKNVIHTGIVSEDELVDLYNLVNLFVFPSLYEGFGLPVIEALACGTKVACSNSSSLPEVGGNVVAYFNPNDIDAMAKVIGEELERTDTIEDRQRRIKWAKSFNWEKTSEEVKKAFALYENNKI